MKFDLILLIAGKSVRFGSDKQNFVFPNGRKMLEIIIKNISQISEINQVIIVHNVNFTPILLGKMPHYKWVIGSNIRTQSVKIGLKSVITNKVIIHDGARPFLTIKSWKKFIELCKRSDNLITAAKITSSIKQILSLTNDEHLKVIKTVSRKNYFITETPQMFRTNDLVNAFLDKKRLNQKYADEVDLLEHFQQKNDFLFNFFFHDDANPKITFLGDVKKYSGLFI